MTPRRALLFAASSTTLLAALSAYGWALAPERGPRWLVSALAIPVLWALVELALAGQRDTPEHRRIHAWHRVTMGGAGLMLTLGVAFRLTLLTGALDADWAETLRRLRGLSVGLFFVVLGNYLPKLMSPWAPDDEPFDWQRVHRFVGWVFVAAGLALAAVWLTLPIPAARVGAVAVVATASVLAVTRKFISVHRRSLSSHAPSGSTR